MGSEDGSTRTGNAAGNVHGNLLQAGVISGNVHLHQALPDSPASRAVPRQWAPPPPHFTNRSTELEDLATTLADVGRRCGIVVLSGMGGVGKTALALHWLHAVRERFPDGHLYADLAGDQRGPADPGVVLGGFLRSFGYGGDELPNEFHQRVGWFRSALADKKVAVLLDNAATAAQVRALLPPSADSVLVVTSRRRLGGLVLDGARFIEVPPLAPQDGARLLAETIGVERLRAETEPARELATLCGGLPIALSVVAARLVTRRRLRVTDAVQELRAEQNRLSLLSRFDEMAVQPVFDLSYSELSSAGRRIYRAAGQHPGPEFSLEVAAAAAGMPLREADDAIDELVEANLAQEVGEHRYRFHDLVRLHAREQGPEHGSPEPRQVLLQIAEYYLCAAQATWAVTTAHLRGAEYSYATNPGDLAPRFSTAPEALEWLELERTNLIATIGAACEQGLWAVAWHVSYAIWPLFRFHGHHNDRRVADELAIRAAQSMGNAEWEARATRRLALLEQRVGNYERATELLDRCASLFRSADDAYGVANIQDARATLDLSNGRPEDAASRAQKARDEFLRLGHVRKAALAGLLRGEAELLSGAGAAALAHVRAAHRELVEFREVDPFNFARAELLLGRALAAAGDIGTAAPLLESGDEAMRLLRSRPGIALAHRARAELARAEGDVSSARAWLGEAIAQYEHLGDATAAALAAELADLTDEPRDHPNDPP